MMHKRDFQGRVVWITGASSGIGEALAYAMMRRGARLVLSSNEPEELERVKGACVLEGSEVMALPLDLAAFSKMQMKTKQVLDRFGRVDVLVNNGGISQRSLAKDTRIETDQKLMDIDFMGHVALTKAVLPSMLNRKCGHIVVTTSLAGLMGIPLRSAYCAAKHALHGFFDALRAEVWRENIKVTLICPAAVRTDISINALVGDGGKYKKMDNLMAKGISPETCAVQIIKAIIKGKELALVGAGKNMLYW